MYPDIKTIASKAHHSRQSIIAKGTPSVKYSYNP